MSCSRERHRRLKLELKQKAVQQRRQQQLVEQHRRQLGLPCLAEVVEAEVVKAEVLRLEAVELVLVELRRWQRLERLVGLLC